MEAQTTFSKRRNYKSWSLAVAFSCVAVTAANSAIELMPVEAVAGRWLVTSGESQNDRFDMARCGTAWCGVSVDKDGKCGAVAFKFAVAAEQGMGVQFAGTFTRAAGTQPYAIGISLYKTRTGSPTLSVSGHTGESFQVYRRVYPLTMLMSREGDATCTADAKTS